MDIFEEVAESRHGVGIRVFLKGSAIEEFLNGPNIFFAARVNSQVWVGDKVTIEERYLHICSFDESKPNTDGNLPPHIVASFPAGIWLGVRLISVT